MAVSSTTHTGEDVSFYISGHAGSTTIPGVTTYGISDITITVDRGTVEQELIGHVGNYHTQGALSVEGSLTACKLDDSALAMLLGVMIEGNGCRVSGAAADNSLHFYFASALITGFEVTIGDASTITEGSVDFALQYPYMVSSVGYYGTNGTYISDFGPTYVE